VLVATGAAAFADLGLRLGGAEGATRTAEPGELDPVIDALKRAALVKSATWTVETKG